MRALIALFCLLFTTHIAAVAVAAEVAPLDVADQAAPAFDVYTSDDGLSAEVWVSVGVDSRGFVWAGSASSLARFDGYRWQAWPVAGASSLVRDFALDSRGRFWAIFEGDGIALLGDDDQWRIVQDLPGMRHFFEHDTADGERQLWLSYGDGLARLVDGRWEPDPYNGADTIDTIAIAWTGELLGRPLQWMARYNQGGLWYREILGPERFGPWQRSPFPEVQPMALNYLKRSFSRGREELWLLSYTTGLARLDPEGLMVWRAFDSCAAVYHPGPQPEPATDGTCRPAALPTEAMYSAEVTYEPDGTRSVWLSTRAGLVRIRDEQVFVYGRNSGLPSDAVRGLGRQVVDGLDVLWSATEGGLVRAALRQTPWSTVSLLGATENGTFGVMLEPDGRGGERLWIGTSQRGLALLEQGRWQYFSAAAGNLPQSGVRALWRVEYPAGETQRLIAFGDGGLYQITDEYQFQPFETPFDGEQGVFVDHAITRYHPEGRELWLATFGAGIHRLREGKWTQFMPAENYEQDWRVLHLVEQRDQAGRSWLWAAGIGGLWRFDGTGWSRVAWVGTPVAFDSGHALLVERGGRQELWLATLRQGVIRLDVTDALTPRRLAGDDVPPPPDPTVYSILSDSRGNIYVCTNNGVQRLEPMPDGRYASEVFRRVDGLVHDECNSNSQFIDRIDRYWVGTLGGLSLFDQDMYAEESGTAGASSDPDSIHLTGVAFDGEALRMANGPIQVPAGTREVRVDFTLLSGLRESKSTYRSKLVGYETKPADWSPLHRRYFTDLAPGAYTLEIEAVDYAGVAAPPLSIGMDVAPLWWQRRSMHAALAFLVLLLVASGVMWYNRGLRQREQQLKRVVEERTRELSEANQRLTRLSYRDALTGLANRRRLMEVMKREMDRARQRRTAMGLIIVDVDHFKPYNDSFGHVAGDAALTAIAQALVRATRKSDMVARLGGEEFACLVVDTDLATAGAIAERMRQLVAALTPRELGNGTEHLTVSAGVLVRVPREDDDLSSFLTDCDAALYAAKHAGRNCVRHAQVP